VLAHPRSRDGEVSSDVDDWKGTFAEAPEDESSGAVPESVEDAVQLRVQ
jgi:hypothetical protein